MFFDTNLKYLRLIFNLKKKECTSPTGLLVNVSQGVHCHYTTNSQINNLNYRTQ